MDYHGATFADALHASPALAAACISFCGSPVKSRANSDSMGGLRALRLVSKSVGQAAWPHVHHFTLGVGEQGCPADGTGEMALLAQLLKKITPKVLTIDSRGAQPGYPHLGLADIDTDAHGQGYWNKDKGV